MDAREETWKEAWKEHVENVYIVHVFQYISGLSTSLRLPSCLCEIFIQAMGKVDAGSLIYGPMLLHDAKCTVIACETSIKQPWNSTRVK